VLPPPLLLSMHPIHFFTRISRLASCKYGRGGEAGEDTEYVGRVSSMEREGNGVEKFSFKAQCCIVLHI